MQSSSKYQLNRADLQSILRHAFIVALSAFLTYLSSQMNNLSLGDWNVVITASIAIVLKVLDKFLQGKQFLTGKTIQKDNLDCSSVVLRRSTQKELGGHNKLLHHKLRLITQNTTSLDCSFFCVKEKSPFGAFSGQGCIILWIFSFCQVF